MGGGTSTGEFRSGIDHFLSEESKPNISNPYILVIGNIAIGDYSIIEYNNLKDARNREIKENEQSKLTKILKVVPYEKDNLKKQIMGYVVHKFEDGIQLQDLPLSIDDVFIGKNPKVCKKEADERKEKYTGNEKYTNPIYGYFKPEQVMISSLYEVKEK